MSARGEVSWLSTEEESTAKPEGPVYERYVKDVSAVADELERRRGEEITHFMLESADVLVMGLRPDGVIDIFNRKCQELSGYSRSEALGRMTVRDILPEKYRADPRLIMNRFVDGTLPRSFVAPLKCKNGMVCYVRWTHTIIRDREGNISTYLGFGDDITARRHLEEELERTKERYTKLVHSLPVGVLLTDGRGRVQVTNEMLEEMLKEVRRPEKRDFNVLSNPYFVENGISHIFRRAITNVETTEEKGTKFVGPRGKVSYFNVRVAPVVDEGDVTGTTAIFEDITERKQIEQRFKSSQAIMAGVLEQAGLAITVVDNAGIVQLFNRGATELTGYSEDEIRGRPIAVFFKDRQRMFEINRRFKRDGMVTNVEASISRKDGTEVPIALSMSMLRDAEGELIGSMGISVDLSQQKELEQELSQASKLAVLGRFSAGVAHEINTPLANISLITENLEMTDLDPRIRKKLGIIQSQVDRATRIVRDLLQYSRKIEPEPAVFDLAVLLDECLGGTPMLPSESIGVVRDYTEGITVNADKEQLRQVFDNLLRNACEAMPEGGRLEISARAEGNQVSVTVVDTGGGIAPEDINNIFEPFFTKKKEKGTGLGLSISQGIMDAHGGAILVQSQVGEGSTFTVKVPRNVGGGTGEVAGGS